MAGKCGDGNAEDGNAEDGNADDGNADGEAAGESPLFFLKWKQWKSRRVHGAVRLRERAPEWQRGMAERGCGTTSEGAPSRCAFGAKFVDDEVP